MYALHSSDHLLAAERSAIARFRSLRSSFASVSMMKSTPWLCIYSCVKVNLGSPCGIQLSESFKQNGDYVPFCLRDPYDVVDDIDVKAIMRLVRRGERGNKLLHYYETSIWQQFYNV